MKEPAPGSPLPIRESNRRRWIATTAKALAVIGVSTMAFAKGGGKWWLSRPSDPYPLVDCVVCDSELDDSVEFFDIDGREIRVLANVDCGADFSSSTDRWLEEIDERIVAQQKPLYPLATCVVTGESIETSGGIEFVYRNRLFLISSDECRDAIEKEPGKYFLALNKAVIEKQKPAYPLDKCLVSGRPLGAEAVDYVVANRLIRLADEGQIEVFDRLAGRHLAELGKLATEKAGGDGQ